MNRDRARRRTAQESGDWEPVELVDLSSGEDLLEAPPPRRPIRARWWVAVALVAAVVVAITVYRAGGSKPEAISSPSRTPSPSAVATPTVAQPRPDRPPPVIVTRLGRPIVPARPGWELFARGAAVVVRLELAPGRITSTEVPPLTSDGPVSFFVGADRAIVRPIDTVLGYTIVDGKPARPLTAPTLQNGMIYPGPDPRHLWASTNDDQAVELVDLDGRATGTALPVLPFQSQPDGTGYLVFADTGGSYLARPSGLRRITSGQLQAIGPTRWLASECDARHRCATVVVDRSSGSRHRLGARRDYTGPPGLISADGRIAALTTGDGNGGLRLYLLDLHSGRSRAVKIDLPTDQAPPAYLWSPDGRWLFVLDSTGRIVVVDRAAHVRALGVTLPPLTQLGFRSLTR